MKLSHEGRIFDVRHGTSDQAIFEMVFGERAHIPPSWMPDPDTVLDLGANIGLTAVHYSMLWPKATITAVEMDKHNAEMARKNFRGKVICKAVCAEKGTRRYDSRALPASYTLGEGDREVKCITLHDLPEADFCKMDIEGSEEEVIQAGYLPYRYLLVECHQQVNGYYMEKAMADLHDLGFLSQIHHAGRQAVFAWNTA